MTRKEFMDILKDNLRGMSQEEKNDIIEYYEEYFEEAGPEKEAEVIAELGSPRNLGIRLSGEYAVRSLNGQGVANGSASAGQGNAAKQTSSGSVWKTVLIVMALIIGSPLILPAAIVAVVLVFVFIVVVVSLGIAAVAVLFVGAAAFFVGIAAIFAGTFSKGLLAIGTALLIFGFGILGVLAIIGIVKGIQKRILWIGNKKLNKEEEPVSAPLQQEAPTEAKEVQTDER